MVMFEMIIGFIMVLALVGILVQSSREPYDEDTEDVSLLVLLGLNDGSHEHKF